MKIPEVTITKRTIAMPHECDYCGSMKDGARYLSVDIADESDVNRDEMYLSLDQVTACVHNGCAERLIAKLRAVESQCKMSDEVTAVTVL